MAQARSSPPPTDVTVHLGAEGGKDVKHVKLTALTTPAGQFASEPGQYPDELRGRLEVVCGGRVCPGSVHVPLASRQSSNRERRPSLSWVLTARVRRLPDGPAWELDAERLGRRIRVALGHEPGDLLITGGQVVNVFNRRVEPADVVIADGRIAGVGCYSWQAKETDRRGGSGAHPRA